MPKLLLRLILLITFIQVANGLIAQNTSSQNSFYIAELEAAQSKVTETFVSCSMRRLKYNLTSDEQILIHRSDDNTANWTLVETLIPTKNDRYIDPVMTVDEAGNFYVIFMRIEHSNSSINERSTALDLYRSVDDGLTWEFVGSPFIGFFPDYPQIISAGDGQLFFAFADFTSYSHSILKFMTSTDRGETWSSPLSFPFPQMASDGGGLEDLQWGQDSSLLLSFGNNEFKGPCVTKSLDRGITWSDYKWANPQNTTANTAVLSKIVAHPNVDFYGVFAHRPHFEMTTMTYHFEKNEELGTIALGNGSYAETILTADSIIHFVYNSISNDSNFQVLYRASYNEGLTFTDPVVLYQAPYQITERGEYQSLILGTDDQFYLTFCDGSDSSMAKTIVFPPQKLKYKPIPVHVESSIKQDKDYRIYPNPVQERLHLNLPQKAVVKQLWIQTANGTRVMQLNNNNLGNWNISNLPNGMYWLHIQEENRFVVQPFLKSGK